VQHQPALARGPGPGDARLDQGPACAPALARGVDGQHAKAGDVVAVELGEAVVGVGHVGDRSEQTPVAIRGHQH